jgi:hypothetical protein
VNRTDHIEKMDGSFKLLKKFMVIDTNGNNDKAIPICHRSCSIAETSSMELKQKRKLSKKLNLEDLTDDTPVVK